MAGKKISDIKVNDRAVGQDGIELVFSFENNRHHALRFPYGANRDEVCGLLRLMAGELIHDPCLDDTDEPPESDPRLSEEPDTEKVATYQLLNEDTIRFVCDYVSDPKSELSALIKILMDDDGEGSTSQEIKRRIYGLIQRALEGRA